MAPRPSRIDEVGDSPGSISVSHCEYEAVPFLQIGKQYHDGVAGVPHILKAERTDIVLRARKRVPIQVANAAGLKTHVVHEQLIEFRSEPVSRLLDVVNR